MDPVFAGPRRTARSAQGRRPAESDNAPPPHPFPVAADPPARVSTRPVAPGPGTGRGPRRAQDLLSKIGQRKVAPSPTATGELDDSYGLTWPEALEISLEVKHTGDQWVPQVTDLEGHYSIQARILPHQADVPNASVATAANYQAILDALRTHGEPGDDHDHYSLKAVQQHESRHATRVLQALEETKGRISTDVAATAIADDTAIDATAAEAQIRASAAFLAIVDSSAPLVTGNAYDAWFQKLLDLVQTDHEDHGPCEVAEESITDPIVAAIEKRSVDERWVGAPAQKAMPVGYVKPAWPPVS